MNIAALKRKRDEAKAALAALAHVKAHTEFRLKKWAGEE